MHTLHHSASRGHAPAEVTAPPADTEAYEEWREADTLGAPYRTPAALLLGIRNDGVEAHLECPLLVFVNARSGGRVGADLALRLSRAVGRLQVFDIGDREHRPDRVLGRVYDNLRAMEAAGDPRAALLRGRMRLLVCGGDGTIAWVMGVIKKLRLQPEPPIAIMPLGTGNDLSRSFLWGGAFTHRWIRSHKAMYETLNRVAVAREERLDCWNITITTPRRAMLAGGYPHCLAPPQPPATPAAAAAAAAAFGGGGGRPSNAASAAAAYARGHSSGLGAASASAAAAAAAQQQHPAVHPAVTAAAAAAQPAFASDRSVAASMAATLGSAAPLQNIATSSVGSAVTAFTTATNMSMAGGTTTGAVAGNSIPPTIMSGAVSNSAEEDSGIGVLGGTFWNYFSIGLDARAAWSFHSLREDRPGCTSSRAANQFWYSAFSCTSGWFCCAQPLNVKVTLEVLRPGPGGDAAGWQPVKLPANVKALVVLNLQSYAGGRNLWGPVTSAADEKKHGFKQPAFDDGMLEVVGLQSGWHAGLVMASNGNLLHASRICQAAGVRLALSAPYVRHDDDPSHVYMQVDGEPWRQDIPVKGVETPVRVEIVHGGQSRLLRNEPLPARAGSMRLSAAAAAKASAAPPPPVRLTHLGAPAAAAAAPPLVTATSEAAAAAALASSSHPYAQPTLGSAPVSHSQSQPSIHGMAAGQLAAGQGQGPGRQPSASGSLASGAGAGQPASGGSGLQYPYAGGGGSMGAAAAAVRAAALGGGRPSPSRGGSAAGSVSALGALAASKQGENGADGSVAGTGLPSPANTPTPRTLSADMGSQGGRSVATQG